MVKQSQNFSPQIDDVHVSFGKNQADSRWEMYGSLVNRNPVYDKILVVLTSVEPFTKTSDNAFQLTLIKPAIKFTVNTVLIVFDLTVPSILSSSQKT